MNYKCVNNAKPRKIVDWAFTMLNQELHGSSKNSFTKEETKAIYIILDDVYNFAQSYARKLK